MSRPADNSGPASEDIRRLYQLEPHPEGGYYKRTYQSTGVIPQEALPGGFDGPRFYGTAILYLLEQGDKSRLHRIKSDETWHFHLGGPLRLVVLNSDGVLNEIIMGPDILSGHCVQFTVPGGAWFGAKPLPGVPYAFVGCTVNPGFDFNDFELADKADLLETYPAYKHIITEYCD